MNSPPARERVFYVDAIRSCAAFLVVISHVFAPVCASMNDYPRSIWWVFNVLDSVIRISVSLYVMISGKLLLGSTREESYLRFVWRRYTRLILPFFVWSMIYAYYGAHSDGESFVFGKAVVEFLKGPTAYHLWFMYMILGLYLVAPFLRRFVRAAEPSDFKALLLLWMGFLTVQFLFPDYVGSGAGTTFLDYVGYFLLGYILDKEGILRGKVAWPAGVCAVIIGINAVATYFHMLGNGGEVDDKYYSAVAPLVAVYAAAFYLTLKNINYHQLLTRHPWLRALMTRLSRQSYNVYLNHAFFIWVFTHGHLGFVLSEDTGPNALIGVTLTSAAVLACSLGFSLGMQKIPFISKLFVISPPERVS